MVISTIIVLYKSNTRSILRLFGTPFYDIKIRGGGKGLDQFCVKRSQVRYGTINRDKQSYLITPESDISKQCYFYDFGNPLPIRLKQFVTNSIIDNGQKYEVKNILATTTKSDLSSSQLNYAITWRIAQALMNIPLNKWLLLTILVCGIGIGISSYTLIEIQSMKNTLHYMNDILEDLATIHQIQLPTIKPSPLR